jgi:hypothetical protein
MKIFSSAPPASRISRNKGELFTAYMLLLFSVKYAHKVIADASLSLISRKMRDASYPLEEV